MKKNICFCLLLILIVLSPKHIKASCSDSEIIRLQKLASNVNITYTANENTQKFDIIITNLKNDLVLKDVYSNKIYNTNREVIIKNAGSGQYTFMIYANTKCSNDYIKTKYIQLPYYNMYYNSQYCNGISEYAYCSKWLNKNIDVSLIIEKTNLYKEKKQSGANVEKNNEKSMVYVIVNKIQQIYKDNYLIILPTIIIILCLIVYVKNKKERIV